MAGRHGGHTAPPPSLSLLAHPSIQEGANLGLVATNGQLSPFAFLPLFLHLAQLPGDANVRFCD